MTGSSKAKAEWITINSEIGVFYGVLSVIYQPLPLSVSSMTLAPLLGRYKFSSQRG
jgi:hypothetical protein